MYVQAQALQALATNMNSWKEQGLKFAYAALRSGAAGFSVAVDVDKVLEAGLAVAGARTSAALGGGIVGKVGAAVIEHVNSPVNAVVGGRSDLSRWEK